MPADAPRREPDRHGPHRTWPERLSIGGTFVSALVCFAVAAALLIGYSVVRNRNIAEFENPAEVAQAAGEEPEPPLLPATTGAAASTTATPGTTAVTLTTSTTSSTSASASASAGEPGSTTAITEPPVSFGNSSGTTPAGDGTLVAAVTDAVGAEPSTTAAAPTATFPAADPQAQNFLITGADNGACIDPDSPTAGGIGDRESLGERSDTIMLIRVDPEANRAAVLSFPRDLWVEIAGSGSMQRINSAYEKDEPQKLADTIYDNFGVPIDHYIQVDFCAFKTLVDAVGGVSIPFDYPARDDNTGLNIETTGCVNLDGDMALAYVRSRHYQYEDPAGSGNWESDGTSDLGRISRQQDFLRRVLSSLLDKGPLNPSVARGLIRAGTDYIVTDRDLTPAKMMEFAGVMNDVDPATITTYQIEATGRTINGNSVLVPNIDGENMQAVLGLFRGETSLADAPVQQFEQTTTAPPRGSTTTTTIPDTSDSVSTESAGSDGASTEPPASGSSADSAITDESVASTVPSGEPQENQFGIVPPRDVTC